MTTTSNTSSARITAGLVLMGGLAITTSAASADTAARTNQGFLRRLRFAQSPNIGTDASSYFDESPLINEAFGDLQDIAETEKFFRRLGGSMSMSKSKPKSKDSMDGDGDDGGDVGVTGASMDVPTPTAKPPTMKPPNMKPPTMKSPTMKPPTMKPPTMKPPTMKPPTMKPPTSEPAPEPTPKPPTAKPPTAGIEPQPPLCSLEGEKAEECGADPKPGRPKMCCEDLVCNEDRICVTPIPVEPTTEKPTKMPVEEPLVEDTPEPTKMPVEEPVEDTPEPTKMPVEEPVEDTPEPTKMPVMEPTPEGEVCSAEGEKAVDCGADPKPGRPEMCCEDLVCSDDRTCVMAVPTKAPVETPEPTEMPVVDPTPEPTEMPVKEPTDAPVAAPVEEPVAPPTEMPVMAPTVEEDSCSAEGEKAEECGADPKPGRGETCCGDLVCGDDRRCVMAVPTEPPVETPEPTEMPVVDPTDAPVAPPTEAPVVAPTEAPVVAPTEAPVVAPTEAPVEAPVAPPIEPPVEAPVAPPTDPPVEAPVAPGTMAPTPNCNLSERQRTRQILRILDDVSSAQDLEDFTTPQGMAYEFIINDDEAQLCPDDENLIQRYVAAVLYYSTDGDGWAECFAGDTECGQGVSYYGGQDAFLSAGSECNWAGLECNEVGELQRIELYDNNLGGTIPSELGALLVVDTIELQENSISGEMPSAVCDNVSPLGEITSLITDCGGSEPLVVCECCTRCFRP